MPRAPKSCANPLFYSWVQEFHDEKDYRKRGGPPRATGYENALHSIAACTTAYAHPKELLALSGVGPTCVERLTEKLEEHCAHRGTAMPEFKKKERAKKAPAAPKKAARRVKKPVEDEEDSDGDFPSSSKAKKMSSRAKGSDDEEEENLPPRKKRTVESDSEDYVSAAPVASKRRVVPVRASAKRAAVIEPESSDYES
ncbi:hypothetical protein C8R44DRAFT_161907 [Mycena epipterygia]|nr:hypothetical protein C8R44DRAFT_161907 [Mycena epipterygia]